MMFLSDELSFLVHDIFLALLWFTARMIKTTLWTKKLALAAFQKRPTIYAMLPEVMFFLTILSVERKDMRNGQR